ncbi:unnamed protein product [marine sediment metagenome]|uniref:Uncharacterized protein n=1 Tax=marine sediment metagenome TaxID=412755 RepID=X1S2N6_9ZZZZ
MVNIENITRKEEEKKLKVKRTNDLLKKFFGDVCISNTPFLISVSEKKKPSPFLSINYLSDEMILRIPNFLILKYTEKTIAFAEEYEKKFNVEVTLETDYSK